MNPLPVFILAGFVLLALGGQTWGWIAAALWSFTIVFATLVDDIQRALRAGR